MTTVHRTHVAAAAAPPPPHVRVRRLLGVLALAATTLTVTAPGAHATTPPCGSVLVSASSWLYGHGVDARSNGAQQGTGYNCGSESYSNPAVQDGNAWQCVELAARLYAVKGWGTIRAGGNGGAKYLPEGSTGVTFYPNGSGRVPVPGDLIIHTDGTWGHVTVVDRVTASSVQAVEQNASWSGRRSYSLAGSTLSDGTAIRGVLHSPANRAQNDWTHPIAADTNGDGRLEVLGVNSHVPDGTSNIFQRWQTSPGGSWSGWSGVAGYLTSVAVARNKDGRLEEFGVNTHVPDGTNNVFQRWQTSPGGSWSSWSSIPGYLTDIAAETNADGRIEVFGVNSHVPDGTSNIFQRWQTSPGGAWSGWSGVPGYLTNVAMARNKDGRLEVFGVNTHIPDGTDNIFQRWQTSPGGSWSGWSGIAGYLTSIAAETNADGRIEVFGVNSHIPDGTSDIFQRWQTSPGGSWSGWSGVPGYLTSLAMARNKDGRLEVVGVNSHVPDGTNDVFQRWQTSPGGSWSSWAGVAGYLA